MSFCDYYIFCNRRNTLSPPPTHTHTHSHTHTSTLQAFSSGSLSAAVYASSSGILTTTALTSSVDVLDATPTPTNTLLAAPPSPFSAATSDTSAAPSSSGGPDIGESYNNNYMMFPRLIDLDSWHFKLAVNGCHQTGGPRCTVANDSSLCPFHFCAASFARAYPKLGYSMCASHLSPHMKATQIKKPAQIAEYVIDSIFACLCRPYYWSQYWTGNSVFGCLDNNWSVALLKKVQYSSGGIK